MATRQSTLERCRSERTSSRLACAPPARVGVAELVVVPHEPVRLADVGHACGREGRAAGVAAAGVLPRVAPLGQARLGVARARRVLGRAGRLHDRGVDHRAAAHDQSGRLEAGGHDVEQGPPDVVLLQEVAEVLEGRGVGHAVPAPHEVADGEAVVAGVLAGGVGQVRPAPRGARLGRRLGGPGLPAAPARARPRRLDQGRQPRPRAPRSPSGRGGRPASCAWPCPPTRPA